MRTTVAALLVGCVVLAACAPAHAAAGRQLRSEEDEAAAAGYPIQPAGMDLARIQSFVQSLVTGEAAKPAEGGEAKVQNKRNYSYGKNSRKRSEYKTEDEEEKKGSYGKHKKDDYEKEDKPYGVHKHMCKQVLLEEEEAVLEWDSDDKATITTLQGTCANAKHPLPTLGGGCAVECEHDADLLKVTALGSHAFAAPAHFAPVPGYFPVSCSFRTEGPLKGSCKVVMKVACCSNKDLDKKHHDDDKAGKYVSSAAAYADGEKEGHQYNEDGETTYDKPKVEHSYYKGGKSSYKPKYGSKYSHKKEGEHKLEHEAPKGESYEYPKAEEPVPELVEDEEEYLVIIKTDVKHIKLSDYYSYAPEKPEEPEKPYEHRHSYERRSDEYHHA